MAISLDNVASDALLLSQDQRIELAQRLLSSVEPAVDAGVEAAWDEEIKQRIKQYDAGVVTPIPVAEVFANLDRKLKK